MSQPLVSSQSQAAPDAVLIHMMSYLRKSEFVTCAHVCKNWRQAASNNLLWKEPAKEMFGEVPKTCNFKAFMNKCESQKLKSNQEILDRIQSFVNRVSLGQNARFTCFIGMGGAGHKAITIEIKATKDKIADPDSWALCQNEVHLTDDYLAVNGIGDGSLLTPQPPPSPTPRFGRVTSCYGVNFHHMHRLIVDGRFSAVIIFPFSTDSGNRVDLEQRTISACQVRLNSFESQHDKQQLTTIAHVGVAVASYFINRYVSSSIT